MPKLDLPELAREFIVAKMGESLTTEQYKSIRESSRKRYERGVRVVAIRVIDVYLRHINSTFFLLLIVPHFLLNLN